MKFRAELLGVDNVARLIIQQSVQRYRSVARIRKGSGRFVCLFVCFDGYSTRIVLRLSRIEGLLSRKVVRIICKILKNSTIFPKNNPFIRARARILRIHVHASRFFFFFPKNFSLIRTHDITYRQSSRAFIDQFLLFQIQ